MPCGTHVAWPWLINDPGGKTQPATPEYLGIILNPCSNLRYLNMFELLQALSDNQSKTLEYGTGLYHRRELYNKRCISQLNDVERMAIPKKHR